MEPTLGVEPVLVVGLLGALLGAIALIRNVAALIAGALLGLSLVVLLFTITFGLPTELFFLSLILATLMVIVGFVVSFL